MRQWLLWTGVAAFALGCGEDEGGGASDDGDGAVRPLEDMGVETDRGVAPDPDTGIADDATPGDADVPPGDSGPLIREVEDCEDACGVYERCGRIGEFFGSPEQCATACADAETSPRYRGWLACLAVEDCAELQECAVPQRPPPACAEVCAAIESCEADFRVPTDCAAACQDAALAPTLQRCGVALVRPPTPELACDEPRFAQCVLQTTENTCLSACSRRSDCGQPLDLVDCTLACAAAGEAEDPVARRRAELTRQCVINADNCEGVAACGGDRPIVGDTTVEELCTANEACAFFAAEGCAATAASALRDLRDGAVDCLAEGFAAGCESNLSACFRPAPAPGPSCDEHCAVSNLCGLLPEGRTEFDCLEDCRATLAGGDADAVGALTPVLACAFGPDCAAVTACQASAPPDIACGAFCDRQVECGLAAEREACMASCRASVNTDRQRAAMACAEVAATCEGVGRCTPPPAPPCEEICQPLAACGLADAGCLTECDNASFADPGSFLPHLACLEATARCDARAVCESGDVSGGDACFRWCAAQRCAGDMRAEEACVRECIDGFAGAKSLQFEGTRECLAAAAPDAGCDVLGECLDPPEGFYCEPACDALARCTLVEDAQACATECGDDAGDEGRIEESACILRAERRQEGCRAVLTCTGEDVPPPSAACGALCEVRHRCDEDLDAFLCERQCDAEAAGNAVRVACAGRAQCDELDACLAAPADIPPACADACGAIAACDGLIGEEDGALYADAETCAADCAGGAVLQGEAFPAAVLECAESAAQDGCDADAVRACFSEPSNLCRDTWDALVSCGAEAIFGGGDEGQFLITCQQNLAMDEATTTMQAQCIQDVAAQAAGDQGACFGGLFGCFFPM